MTRLERTGYHVRLCTVVIAIVGVIASCAKAGSLNCKFSANSGAESVINNRLIWKDGTPDVWMHVFKTDDEGHLEVGGVIDRHLSIYGFVALNGTLSIVSYGATVMVVSASQGRCTGLDTFKSEPVLPSRTPSGFSNLATVALLNCVSDGKHTGVVGLRGGAADKADGTVSDLFVERKKTNEGMILFRLADSDVVGVVDGDRVLIIRDPGSNTPSQKRTDICH